MARFFSRREITKLNTVYEALEALGIPPTHHGSLQIIDLKYSLVARDGRINVTTRENAFKLRDYLNDKDETFNAQAAADDCGTDSDGATIYSPYVYFTITKG